MTFTHALSTNNYGPAKFIVSSSAANGTHTTIAAALTSSSSGDTIFIRPGTYTENPTLKAGVNLCAFDCDAVTPNVIINGKCTFTTAGTVTISGINFQTNSDYAIAVTGSVASILNLNNCYLNCLNNTGINFTSSSGSSLVNLYYCRGNLATTGISIYTMSSAGIITIDFSDIRNSGSSTTASTNSAGSVQCAWSNIHVPLSSSSTGGLNFQYCDIDCGNLNTTPVTFNGTGTSTQRFNLFSGGTASSVSIGAGAAANILHCDMPSSNANVLTGAGTLNYAFISFSGSTSGHNVTTENAYATLV